MQAVSGKIKKINRESRRMKQGIIFDMDGTLWDSAENVAKSWNLVIEESGLLEKTLTAV